MPPVLGPYHLLQVLGEGGMGIVFLAEQREPIQRRVALKVIKPGAATREVLARFEAERQALALMDHPNIARVLDAGLAPGDRPYFVMEYVPGLPITEYCDRQRLANAERLALFVTLCAALQHAHQKGVIHRDLKPSNVLVTVQDGKAVPKVIDFGIVKATQRAALERGAFTEFGTLIGTPEYMSPEQAEGSALEVDTTTDIYSLGVILYELLSGALPFDPATLREAGYLEMHRIIRAEDPPKPSARARTLGATAEEVAKHRHSTIGALEKQLRGDLDAIVFKAMEKDRTRRYASASEFAADIDRYLTGQAVVARPASALYRSRKFVRRHRLGVAAACAVFFALACGVVVTTWLYVRSETARERAEMQATRNRLDADALQAVFRQDPQAYERLSNEALALHRQALGPANPALAPYLLNRLAVDALVRMMFLSNAGDRPKDVEQIAEAVMLIEQGLDAGDAGAVKTLLVLSDLVGPEQSDLPRLHRKAFDLLKRPSNGSKPATAEQLGLEADLLEKVGATAGSDTPEPLAREVLELRREAEPPDSPKLVFSLTRLADILGEKAAKLWTSGQVAAAASAYREAAAVVRESLPAIADKNDRLTAERRQAELETDRALCLAGVGRFDEAEVGLKRRVEALRTQETTQRSATTEMALNGLVDLYEAWGKPGEAVAYRARLQPISIRTVRDLGVVRSVPPVLLRRRGASARVAGRSVWLFGETTVLRSGLPQWADNSWGVMDASASYDSLVLRTPTGAGAVPVDLLPKTAEEASAGIHLDPGAVVWDEARHRALVFYTKRSGEGDRERRLGTSLAVWPALEVAPERPNVRAGIEDPTLLFGGDEPPWGAGALIVGDSLYVYGMQERNRYRLARVPLAHVLDRSAWRFYADGSWVPDWRRGSPVIDGLHAISVAWNSYLGKYLAVNTRGISNLINVRTADRPEGPWSGAVLVDALPPPVGWPWIGSAVAHSQLSREGGRFEVLTYDRWLGNGRSETRALEIQFRKR